MENMQNSNLLKEHGTIACVDASYMIYHIIFSAVNKWTAESQFSDAITDVDMEDPSFVHVDLTTYPDFIETIDDRIIRTLRCVTQLVNDYNSLVFSHTVGKILLVFDPPKGSKLKSWRYLIYPEYKGQRKAAREAKPFDVMKVFHMTSEMIRTDPKYSNMFDIDVTYADGCECDDIIATYFMDEKHSSYNKFLISADKDFLQLEGVTQMNLEGKQIEIEQPYPDMITVTPSTYLLAKIITGDTSDNITQVFNRVGYKTAVKKYVSNLQYLTESLEHDKVAYEKFKMNTRLIDFKKIPKKIRSIAKSVLCI